MFKRVSEAVKRHDWFSVAVEFGVVVFGIFLALQVDSWNQGRADRALERGYLERLAADTEWNIENFQRIEEIFGIKARTISDLKHTSPKELIGSDLEGFLERLEYTTYIALPPVRSETFDELESSGRLLLLRSVELRSQLSIHYAEYALMQEILDEPIGNYRRLYYENVPGDNYFDWRLNGTIDDTSEMIQALEKLQSNPNFEAAANAEIAYAASIIYWLRHHREKATQVLGSVAGRH